MGNRCASRSKLVLDHLPDSWPTSGIVRVRGFRQKQRTARPGKADPSSTWSESSIHSHAMRSTLAFLLLSLCVPNFAVADISVPRPVVAPVKKSPPPKPVLRPVTPAVNPPPNQNPRDPVSVARSTPAVLAQIAKMKNQGGPADQQSGQPLDEVVTNVQLGGQCGFAGCSSTHLVAFTYKTRGANTATASVLALVSCPPIMQKGCTATLAEVRPTGQLEQAQ